jgi:Putative peptidoglycan binding domain
MKYYLTLFVVAVLLVGMSITVGGNHASAQTISAPITNPVPSTKMCVSITTNLRTGSRGSDVVMLQNYLGAQGYFPVNLWQSTASGFFGLRTRQAVVAYQAAHDLPSTGYVGPRTRAVIKNESCSISQSSVQLLSISPSTARVGDSVTITGINLSDKNTVLMGGSVVSRDVTASGSTIVRCAANTSCVPGLRKTIQFTVPDSLSPNCPVDSLCPQYQRILTPGVYPVTIVNADGVTSNALSLTITGPAGGGSGGGGNLSITRLDAPSTLSMTVPGTWTVNVTTNTAVGGSLHYSVVWGDEVTALTAARSIQAPPPTDISSTATFTHTYTRGGTYTPTFTVTDDAGHSVQTSASVVVTPIY